MYGEPYTIILCHLPMERCTMLYNQRHTGGSNPECFPHGQTTQKVNGNNLNAEDAGTITCTVTISGRDYTSRPLTLRISGEQLPYS